MTPWRPDSPIELPNGSLGCGAHGLVVCGICTVDYSFMQEATSNDLEYTDDAQELSEEDEQQQTAPGFFSLGYIDPFILSGETPPDVSNVFPSAFIAPSTTDTPQSLFDASKRADPAPYKDATINGRRYNQGSIPDHYRLVRRSNQDEILIYTDGACLGNGQANPRAGYAFVFYPISTRYPMQYGTVGCRLENQGPTGHAYTQTSNRAELRAVVAALQFRHWVGEGWKRLVIATDSEYVVKGATQWVRGWETRGWITATKQAVKNRDLWELLLKEIRQAKQRGLDVVFWRISRAWNQAADAAAKEAAAKPEVEIWRKLTGRLINSTTMALINVN